MTSHIPLTGCTVGRMASTTRATGASSWTTTLSTEFEISLPVDLCAEMGWKPGQELALIPKGTGLLIIPVPSLDELRGLATGANAGDYRDRRDRF